ncbi:unnamed protein product, partial [Heterosigma akashiwo]
WVSPNLNPRCSLPRSNSLILASSSLLALRLSRSVPPSSEPVHPFQPFENRGIGCRICSCPFHSPATTAAHIAFGIQPLQHRQVAITNCPFRGRCATALRAIGKQ